MPACKHLIEDDAEGPDVGPVVDRLAAGLFRGHVRHGSDDPRGQGSRRKIRRPGQAEIHNLGTPGGSEHDIVGLDIAVNDPLLVGGLKSPGQLDGQVQSLGQVEGAGAKKLPQVRAVDKLHGDEEPSVGFADLMDGGDMRMVQGGRGLRFPLEAGIFPDPAARVGTDELEGNEPFQAGVFGLVDNTHSPFAQTFDNQVVGDALPGQILGVQCFSPRSNRICSVASGSQTSVPRHELRATDLRTRLRPGSCPDRKGNRGRLRGLRP